MLNHFVAAQYHTFRPNSRLPDRTATRVHRSSKQVAVSTHSRQPNPEITDGHGRLSENLEAVGSWCCGAKFSVCEGRWPIY